MPSWPHTSPQRLRSARGDCSHFADEQAEVQAEQATCLGPQSSQVKSPAPLVVPVSASVPREALSFHGEKQHLLCSRSFSSPEDTVLSGETVRVNPHTTRSCRLGSNLGSNPLCHLAEVRPEADHVTFLCLSFLLCKNQNRSPYPSCKAAVGINVWPQYNNSIHVSC